MQTATTSACYFDYAIIENDPPDGEEEQELFTVNSDYVREITFLNTGNCLWERNTSLTFIDGESFNARPRIFIREEVNPGAEITVLFEGTLPARGDAEHPILLSYVDCVLKGYLDQYGERGVSHFIDHTEGWHIPIRDDRENPRYSRAVRLEDRERDLFDQLLRRAGVRFFGRRG